MYDRVKFSLLIMIFVAAPGCLLEPQALDNVEATSTDSSATVLSAELSEGAEVSIDSTGTWQSATVESCNDFPCSSVPTCPAAPEGQSCSPLFAICKERLTGPWVQIYQCL